jgi:hypothetical protein
LFFQEKAVERRKKGENMQSASVDELRADNRMNDNRLRDNLHVLIFIFALFFLLACIAPQTFVFSFDSRLSDGKKIELIYEIDLDDKASVKKFNKNIDKIQYALTMIFSKTSSQDLIAKNESRLKITLKNTLLIILEKYFKGNVNDVRIINFIIQPS